MSLTQTPCPLPMCGGLYVIRLSSDHYYGGRSVNVRARVAGHLRLLKLGRHCNAYMQSVYNIHGVFIPELLIALPGVEDQKCFEQYWLEANVGQQGCVNMSSSAEGGGTVGRRVSAEGRRKLSEAHKGGKATNEAKRKISEALKGRKRSPEVCSKISASCQGRKNSEEARLRMSESHKGLVPTEATRARMSVASKGRRWSEESKASFSRLCLARKTRLGKEPE